MPKLSQDIKNAIDQISNKEWDFINKSLLLHARIKVTYITKGNFTIWKGIPSNNLSKSDLNDMAKYFVSEARYKLLSGERKTWVPQEPIVESLIKFLMGVIDSLVVKKAIKKISDEEWTLIDNMLLNHARKKVRRTKGHFKIWKGISSNRLSESELNDLAKDFVSEARYKLLSGERKTWVPQEPIVKPLTEFLKGVIDSLVSAELTSQKNKVIQPLEPKTTDEEGSGNTSIEQIPGGSKTPEKIWITEQEMIRQSKLVEDFQQHLKDEGENCGVEIVRLGQNEIFKPKQIAEETGCSTTEIRNAKKRLARRLRAFFK